MQRTGIEYLTHTWNPLAMQCTRVSEGCANCWHIRMAKRHAGNPIHSDDVRAAYAGHNIVLREKEIEAPLRLRKPARIGVQFMGDLFLEGVGYHWQERIWDTMERTPQHTYLVLTKRAENMFATLDSLVVSHGVLPNVWGLVTAENQEQADLRIPLLLRSSFAVRGVSIEPMLGAVDIMPNLYDPEYCCWNCGLRPIDGDNVHDHILNECPACDSSWDGNRKLDWVICGGETGPGARTMDPDWARGVRDQCKEAGVSYFFKQMSNKAPIPADLLVREWPEGQTE